MLGTLWQVVVMVSLMNFVAHFVTKYVSGKNSLLIATFLGGLVSSLATILMLLKNNTQDSALSKDDLFLGYVSANAGSVFRAIIITRLAIGAELFTQFSFCLISIFVMFASLSIYKFYAQEEANENNKRQNIRITQRALPLNFIFKFSGILAVLLIFMTMVTHYLGEQAFVMAAFLSGMLSSAAAITSVAASLLQQDGIGPFLGGLAIVGALLGSTFAKYFIIVRHTGLAASRSFLWPIIGMGLLGFATLWLSFSTDL
jgi:uncharacterized membrane protein (DUF4010 family)